MEDIKLHETHGSNVTLSEGRTVAEVEKGCDKEVFSSRPLQPGNTFTIRVEKVEGVRVSITCTT